MALLLTALELPACGSEPSFVPAGPQTVELGWRELDGTGRVGFRLEIQRIVVASTGWSVDAAVTNATGVTFTIGRAHVFGGSKFGLFVREADDAKGWRRMLSTGNIAPQLVADRFVPPLPGRLEPSQTWRGRFTGQGRLPSGSFVRVAFGRFTTTEPVPSWLGTHVLAVTTRSAHIR